MQRSHPLWLSRSALIFQKHRGSVRYGGERAKEIHDEVWWYKRKLLAGGNGINYVAICTRESERSAPPLQAVCRLSLFVSSDYLVCCDECSARRAHFHQRVASCFTSLTAAPRLPPGLNKQTPSPISAFLLRERQNFQKTFTAVFASNYSFSNSGILKAYPPWVFLLQFTWDKKHHF